MTRIFEMRNKPSVAEYIDALSNLTRLVTIDHRSLFRVHYQAPDRTARALELAYWAKIRGGHLAVNRLYGKLGHQVCNYLGIKPILQPEDPSVWWSVWSRGWDLGYGRFAWQMLPEVAEALERIGWVIPNSFALPDEVVADNPLLEGSVYQITVNAYERNSEARRQCINKWGTKCVICKFDFGIVFGPEANGYIHVHHLRPLTGIGHEYEIDPINDLRPVCPNCHAMIHLGGRCRTLEAVRHLRDSHRP